MLMEKKKGLLCGHAIVSLIRGGADCNLFNISWT